MEIIDFPRQDQEPMEIFCEDCNGRLFMLYEDGSVRCMSCSALYELGDWLGQ